MYVLIMVLDDVAHLADVLEAWMGAGVKGVTILESTGVNRVLRRTQARAMFMGFSQVFGEAGAGHNTLFAIIDSLETAEEAVAATEQVIGDLRQPHTGIVFTLPVTRTWGLLSAPEGADQAGTE